MYINSKKFAINFLATIILLIVSGFNLIIGFNDAKIFKSEFDKLYIRKFDNDTVSKMKERTLGVYRYHKMFQITGETHFFPAINDNKLWDPDFIEVGDIITKNYNSTSFDLTNNGIVKKYNFINPGNVIDFIDMTHIYVSIFFLILVIVVYILPYRFIKPILDLRKL